jgi:hypothetical protein
MLTQKFLVNHCSQGLYEQVFTEYDDEGIDDEERGGPLLLINELLVTTEDTAEVLEEPFRNFSLQKIEGENVKKGEAIAVERYSSFRASQWLVYKNRPCPYQGATGIFH